MEAKLIYVCQNQLIILGNLICSSNIISAIVPNEGLLVGFLFTNETKYSSMDQLKFVEDSLQSFLKGYHLLKQTISLQTF